MKNHVVITGTGRTGTTFLVELLTYLGLNTGFSINELVSKKNQEARAGLEYDLRQDSCPYIVKDPWFCDYAEKIIYRDDIFLEHIFIPIRDLNAAAESRRHVSNTTISNLPLSKRLKHKIRIGEFAGGLWHTKSTKPGKQEDILLRQIYKLMLTISDTKIPVTFMRYPKIVKDCSYLFDKLKPILQNIMFESFYETFNNVICPELINSFNKNDC